MPKRTVFTQVTPLSSQVDRRAAISILHSHNEVIEADDSVIAHRPIRPPRDAPADEFLNCVWHEINDKFSYFPGGLIEGIVTYKACFRNILSGLEIHIYGPVGLDIRQRWTIGRSTPGQRVDLLATASNTSQSVLFLKEERDITCRSILLKSVTKNLNASHKALAEQISRVGERTSDRTSDHGQYSHTSFSPLPIPEAIQPTANHNLRHDLVPAFPQQHQQYHFQEPVMHGALQHMSPFEETPQINPRAQAQFTTESSSDGRLPSMFEGQRHSLQISQVHARFSRVPYRLPKQRESLVELPGSMPGESTVEDTRCRSNRYSASNVSTSATTQPSIWSRESYISGFEEEVVLSDNSPAIRPPDTGLQDLRTQDSRSKVENYTEMSEWQSSSRIR